MKFATKKNGTSDGQLLLVSRDHGYALSVEDIAPNLITVLENWKQVKGPP